MIDALPCQCEMCKDHPESALYLIGEKLSRSNHTRVKISFLITKENKRRRAYERKYDKMRKGGVAYRPSR